MQLIKSMPTKLLCVSALFLNLNACSTIKGYFPDKEKDYQLSSQLPPLKIPADIANKGLIKKPSSNSTEDGETVAVIGEIVKAAPAKAGDSEPVLVTEQQEQQQDEPTHVELVKFSNGETRLHINKSVAMSWRIIGKALSRKTIEITSRDQANAEFNVQYDPNETDFKDESFFDELDFVFGKDHNQEKPYHIKLLTRGEITEVVVLNEQDKLISDGSGLSLLKLLSTTIQADVKEE